VGNTTDQTIHDVLAGLVTLLIVGYALWLLIARLRRSRPDLRIATPIVVALLVRALAGAALSLTTIAQSLRGGDELLFQDQAHAISGSAFGSEPWLDALTGALHKFVFALQIWGLGSPELVLRIAQAGIAVAGLALLAAAVYELAGPKAAVIAAWLLALEPTGVFFSTLLHKEPNMMLAGGLVALGGATLWNRGDFRSLVPIVAGCLVAVATRPYAGWFLIAAGAAIVLHAGLRKRRSASLRSLLLISIVVVFAVIFAPTVWQASSNESLRQLQSSQEENVSNPQTNLNLEKVDFSTRGAVISNLPIRIRDVLLRPYPWQLDDVSQQLGLLGTIVAYTTLALLVAALLSSRGTIMERAGPLIYIAFFLLIAYSLSAGNAGTAFRYRTHVVAVAICFLVSLRLRPSTAAEEHGRRLPLPAGPTVPTP
jgi:Dolichyl-phosphate-mannose-protein mannosyltransferase